VRQNDPGKLFQREAGRRNALRGVIYSNLRILPRKGHRDGDWPRHAG